MQGHLEDKSLVCIDRSVSEDTDAAPIIRLNWALKVEVMNSDLSLLAMERFENF